MKRIILVFGITFITSLTAFAGGNRSTNSESGSGQERPAKRARVSVSTSSQPQTVPVAEVDYLKQQHAQTLEAIGIASGKRAQVQVMRVAHLLDQKNADHVASLQILTAQYHKTLSDLKAAHEIALKQQRQRHEELTKIAVQQALRHQAGELALLHQQEIDRIHSRLYTPSAVTTEQLPLPEEFLAELGNELSVGSLVAGEPAVYDGHLSSARPLSPIFELSPPSSPIGRLEPTASSAASSADGI